MAPAFMNVTLIGMPGSGKSTIGRALAAAWGWAFVDVDHLIEQREGKRLEEIIAAVGFDAFLHLEARHGQSVKGSGQVIAPGGSVVYVEATMRHFRQLGPVVYLDVPLPILKQRLGDLKARGVVIAPGRTVADLWTERHPLYQRYADAVVPCVQGDWQESVQAVRQALAADGGRS